ncbi:hypothetical protein HK101_005281 [Irineochytrium annulatum]|nr:hypothetical protein HK101_005281 [Irineochytrium annulatum]
MGGGGLQILQHKSWHPYNQKNKDRVRRDEEKAKKEEDDKKWRSGLADQEHRITELRKRARGKDGDDGDEQKGERKRKRVERVDRDGVVVLPKREEEEKCGGIGYHVNLFDERDFAKTGSSRNAEREAESKAEQVKFERQYTMYLGGGAVGHVDPKSDTAVQWYAQKGFSESDAKYGVVDESERPFKRRKEDGRRRKGISHAERDEFLKTMEDPLSTIRHELSGSSSSKLVKPHHQPPEQPGAPPPKKEKKKLTTVDELRNARLERERKERDRVNAMLAPKVSRAESLRMERDARYNSAFNPALAAQNIR